jgi:hypothetical protein
MKRFTIGFLLVFVGSFCFAKGQRDSFEIGVGYHSITETQTVSGIEVKTTVPSFAINYAGETFYTEKVGIGAYGNFLFPQEFKMSAQGQSVTVDKSAYDFLFAMDFLIGPAFILYKNETVCLPLAIGLHYYHLWANTAIGNTSGNEIGLGANITGEYHFNPNIYFYGRFQLSFDFYSWGTVEVYNGYGTSSASTSGNLSTWGIEPCIGIGFQW